MDHDVSKDVTVAFASEAEPAVVIVDDEMADTVRDPPVMQRVPASVDFLAPSAL